MNKIKILLAAALIALSASPICANEIEQETSPLPPEPNTTILEKKYRIISGKNYNINLTDGNNIIYFIPLNYKVEREEGLGIPRKEDKLQKNEEPDTLSIQNIGVSVIGQINKPELYISLYVSGILPSPCHTMKVEPNLENKNNEITINTLIFSAIQKTRLCVTKPTTIEATFLLPNQLQKNIPVNLKINYQDYSRIELDGNNNLTIYNNGAKWKITRTEDILSQKQIHRRWIREWVEGEKTKPTQKQEPQRPPQTPDTTEESDQIK